MHYKCKLFYVNSIYIKTMWPIAIFAGFCVFGIHLRAPNLAEKTLLEPLCCVRIGKDPPLTLVFMEQCVWNLSCFLSWELCTWPLSFSLGGHSLIFSLSCLCCLCLIHLTISSLFFLSLQYVRMYVCVWDCPSFFFILIFFFLHCYC